MRSTSSRLRSCTIHSYLRPDVRDPKRGAQGSNFDRGVGTRRDDGNERMSFARAFSVKTKPAAHSRSPRRTPRSRGPKTGKGQLERPHPHSAPSASRRLTPAPKSPPFSRTLSHLELLGVGSHPPVSTAVVGGALGGAWRPRRGAPRRSDYGAKSHAVGSGDVTPKLADVITVPRSFRKSHH